MSNPKLTILDSLLALSIGAFGYRIDIIANSKYGICLLSHVLLIYEEIVNER